ncbi:uncharacterized protein LOC130732486 [Lotus japonicus]|uniref:uncharacterized protein LOC130732486 n=1 Tax=Lotus japonicus TaxID=34305 RepID=UPI00258374EF|nr:uncharacterized protein LOC130732486 [Lotus japonicus]
MQKEEQVIAITNSNEHLDSFLCPSFNSYSTDQLAGIAAQVGRDNLNDDTDFEFVAFQETADDDAVFPLFNRDHLKDNHSSDTSALTIRRSERDPPPPTLSGCRKSNSTGSWSSKRWKLLDLLRRSNSDGRESLGSLTPSPSKNKAKEQWNSGSVEVTGKSKAKGFADGGKKAPVSAHEALYVRNRELRRMATKKSFLPYKPELVGFCTRRLGKAFPSF